MIAHLIEYFTKLNFQGWLMIFILFILVAAIYLVSRYIKHPIVKWVSYFVLIVALLRVAFFYNPISWAVYGKVLPLKLIDWRHHDVIISEGSKYLKPQKKIKYLAVGSSQTSVIYNSFARNNDNLAVFSLAGLSPLDLYTYREEIARRRPEFVLLYISEFDIARNPELSSSRWSKFSLSDIYELAKIIDTTAFFTEDDNQIIYDLFFSKYFPEYKYSFVFKDILNRALNKDKLLNLTPPTQINDSISLAIHIQSLKELSGKYIAFNMFYLKKAIQELNQLGVRVIIVEGQYNPRAYFDSNLLLNSEVRGMIKEFTLRHPGNIFLTRDECPNFVIEDYRDGYHVKENSGINFATNLIRQLDSKAL